MATSQQILRADDVRDLLLPDGTIGFELVDGQPVAVTPASPIHGWLVVEVVSRLRNHVKERGIPGNREKVEGRAWVP